MSDVTVTPSRPSIMRRWWTGLTQNPVVLKELRARMRGRRAFFTLTLYLILIAGMVCFFYSIYSLSAQQTSLYGGTNIRDAGKVVAGVVVGVEVMLALFVAPAFTSGAITGEKQNQTYDLLRTTLLSPRSLVSGKLLSALAYVILLIATSIPVLSIAFLLGGVTMIELVMSQIVIVVAAIAYAMWGLYLSAICKTQLWSTIIAFVSVIFTMVFLPFFLIFFLGFGFALWSNLNAVAEQVLAFGAPIVAGLHLPATLIMSDLMLIEEGALFYADVPTSGGRSVVILSPWIWFIIMHLIMTFILYLGTVRRIKQIPKR